MSEGFFVNGSIDEDTLLAYALGILDDDETERVERYVTAHPEAQRRVRAHLEALTALVLSEEPSELPADAESALLARVRAQSSGLDPTASRSERATEPSGNDRAAGTAPPIITAPPPRSRLWLALAAALALVAVGFGLFRPVLEDAWVEYRLDRALAQPGASERTLTADDGERIGRLIRLGDDRVVVAMDAPPPPERVYQAWEIAAGSEPASRGTWPARLFTTPPLDDGNLFGISVEPPGGSPQPTSTPIVVVQL